MTINQYNEGDRVVYLDCFQLGVVDGFEKDDDGFWRMIVKLDSGEIICKMLHWFKMV